MFQIIKPADLIEKKVVVTPREVTFQEFNELEKRYLSVKRKYDDKLKEVRILKQKYTRHETAFKQVISDSYNQGEVDAEAEKKITLLYDKLPGKIFHIFISLIFKYCPKKGFFNRFFEYM